MRSVRRLVTGINEQGKSYLVGDSASEHVQVILPQVPDFTLINLWSTDTTPVSTSSKQDAAAKITGLTPSKNGSIFRMVDFPPESTYLTNISNSLRQQAFANMQAAECADTQNAHPFMHCTETLDYAIVVEGEIYLILDESEHFMRAGDVAIQCATNHAWSNRSDKMCRIAFILLDAPQ